MKCPFRKITIKDDKRNINGITIGSTTREEFAECYGYDCPHYRPRLEIGDVIAPEHCYRAVALNEVDG